MATDHLPLAEGALLRAAEKLAVIERWNVAKIDLRGRSGVSLLLYEEFDAAAFPALIESHRIDLDAGTVDVRRYRENPPILHRKELLLPPEDPWRAVFRALTEELQRRSLFVDMARRGCKAAWEAALASAGVSVRGHDVHVAPASTSDAPTEGGGDMATVARHRTAIGRNTLSAPMAALNAAGLLEDGVSVLDYGCGRGDDVRTLQAAGIEAVGCPPCWIAAPRFSEPEPKSAGSSLPSLLTRKCPPAPSMTASVSDNASPT